METKSNPTFPTQVIGNINYVKLGHVYTGTLSACSVFGKIIYLLSGSSGDNLILLIGKFSYDNKSYNACVPGEFGIYLNLPDNLLTLTESSEEVK